MEEVIELSLQNHRVRETLKIVECCEYFVNFRSLHELRTLWTKDGIPIENSRISYSFNDSWNRTLALISANITYTGVYSCHVDLRSGGYPTVNASAKVVVYGKK